MTRYGMCAAALLAIAVSPSPSAGQLEVAAPDSVWMQAEPDGTLLLRWSTVSGASAYRVYRLVETAEGGQTGWIPWGAQEPVDAAFQTRSLDPAAHADTVWGVAAVVLLGGVEYVSSIVGSSGTTTEDPLATAVQRRSWGAVKTACGLVR